MSAESLDPETLSTGRSIRVVELESFLAQRFSDDDGDPTRDFHNFDPADYVTRTEVAVAMADHIHARTDKLNMHYADQSLGQYPVLPPAQVNRNIASILLIAKKMPTGKGELLDSFVPFVESYRRRYLQIRQVIELGQDLQAEGQRPLACCATDVLLGYGMTLAQGVEKGTIA